MKPLKVPAWFGDITPEEIEAIRGKYAEFEKKITEYQKRPNYEQTAHTERGKE